MGRSERKRGKRHEILLWLKMLLSPPLYGFKSHTTSFFVINHTEIQILHFKSTYERWDWGSIKLPFMSERERENTKFKHEEEERKTFLITWHGKCLINTTVSQSAMQEEICLHLFCLLIMARARGEGGWLTGREHKLIRFYSIYVTRKSFAFHNSFGMQTVELITTKCACVGEALHCALLLFSIYQHTHTWERERERGFDACCWDLNNVHIL